jgi:hypothetical protein
MHWQRSGSKRLWSLNKTMPTLIFFPKHMVKGLVHYSEEYQIQLTWVTFLLHLFTYLHVSSLGEYGMKTEKCSLKVVYWLKVKR